MPWSIFTQGGGQEVAVGWAERLLKLIGAPASPGNVQFVYDWEVSEGGGGKFNPLNQGPDPGHKSYTTTGSQYGGGAADYSSWTTGLLGARDYLNMANFQGIKAALVRNDPSGARSALIASPWASSHYDYGKAFSTSPVPGGKAVLPPIGKVPAGGGGNTGKTLGFNPVNPFSWGSLFSADHLERAGLIILGGLLIMVGIWLLAGKSSIKLAVNAVLPEAKGAKSVAAHAQGTQNQGSNGS